MRHQLETARRSWRAGDWMEARTGAQEVLSAAVVARNAHLEAGASLLLSQVLALQSSFAWGHRFARRARELFTREQDPDGLSDAMLTLSYLDSALGNENLAVRAAEDAAAGAHGIARRPAAGLNYRGVAAAWGGQYCSAHGVLDAACELAPEDAGSRAAVFQPLANAGFTEVLRCAEMRMRGHRVDLSALSNLLARQWALVKEGAAGSLVSGSADPGLFLLEFASCFLASRTGDAEGADRHYLGCLRRIPRLPETNWMQALLWWARLERTLSAGEVLETTVSAARLVGAAEAGEHVPMKTLARRLAAEAQANLATAPSEYATWFA
ncbi:hypothetical protein [Ramlibacter monticola]